MPDFHISNLLKLSQILYFCWGLKMDPFCTLADWDFTSCIAKLTNSVYSSLKTKAPSFREFLREKFTILEEGQRLKHCLSCCWGKGPDSICRVEQWTESPTGKKGRELQVSGNLQYRQIIYAVCILVSHANGGERNQLPLRGGRDRLWLLLLFSFRQLKNISLWKSLNKKAPRPLVDHFSLSLSHLSILFICIYF